MNTIIRKSAIALTATLLIAACGNKEQKNESNVNENPVEEKIEVKNVEGRKNFSDKAVITPLKAFTISFATKDDIAQSDYFGIVSGNDVPDKVAKAGYTITPSPNVDAPIINEYKLTLECKVVTFDEDKNGGARVVGEIVNMSADESILDEEGNIDLGKLQPVIFDSSKAEYRVVGEKVGKAWGSGKAIQEREVK